MYFTIKLSAILIPNTRVDLFQRYENEKVVGIMKKAGIPRGQK
jgi:hypothetical protein